MTYQSFSGDIRGSSNSSTKFQGLKLDHDLIKNKTCLDLGCNEGYFCFKLVEHGAKEVIGVDMNLTTINKANTRLKKSNTTSNISFKQVNWSEIDKVFETSKFDLILHLSAFHYATQPNNFNQDGTNKLLNKIKDLLVEGGCLIWEGGRIDTNSKGWIKINRGHDIVYHATKTALEELFTKTFTKFVCVGPSVSQQGDPVPRFVYHCFK